MSKNCFKNLLFLVISFQPIFAPPKSMSGMDKKDAFMILFVSSWKIGQKALENFLESKLEAKINTKYEVLEKRYYDKEGKLKRDVVKSDLKEAGKKTAAVAAFALITTAAATTVVAIRESEGGWTFWRGEHGWAIWRYWLTSRKPQYSCLIPEPNILAFVSFLDWTADSSRLSIAFFNAEMEQVFTRALRDEQIDFLRKRAVSNDDGLQAQMGWAPNQILLVIVSYNNQQSRAEANFICLNENRCLEERSLLFRTDEDLNQASRVIVRFLRTMLINSLAETDLAEETISGREVDVSVRNSRLKVFHTPHEQSRENLNFFDQEVQWPI